MKKIFVPRRLFDTGFNEFLSKKNLKNIWSIYGAGGTGKSTLLEKFYETLVEQDKAVGFLSAPEREVKELAGLEVLLYELSTEHTKHFKKIHKIISKKYRSLSAKLGSIEAAAGAVPAKAINGLITELADDSDYLKEIGLVWGTLIGTFKVVKQLLNREHKDQQIEANPELHLLAALAIDLQDDGVLLFDTFEKMDSIKVQTTLKLELGKLRLTAKPYPLTMKAYLGMINNYLGKVLEEEEKNLKVILAGRGPLNGFGEYSSLNIQQDELKSFEPTEIQAYFEQLQSIYLPDFPLPNEEQLLEIEQLTKGNALLISFLIQYILKEWGEDWDWATWSVLQKEFAESKDKYGLLYYLIDRIASHIEDWEQSLWKLAIPLDLDKEVLKVLFEEEIKESGNLDDYLKELIENGILTKGKEEQRHSYFLHDEIKSCLQNYIKTHYGTADRFYLDAPELLNIHSKLQAYYDDKGAWATYSDDLNPLDSPQEGDNHPMLFKAAYHSFLSTEAFEKQHEKLQLTRKEFWQYVINSPIITNAAARHIGGVLSNLVTWKISNLLNIFTAQQTKLAISEPFKNYVLEQKQNNPFKESSKWYLNDKFLKKAIQRFPEEPQLLCFYGDRLKEAGKYAEAEVYYKRAIKADSKHANSLGNYAVFLASIRGKERKAEKYFLQAIEADSEHASNLYNYARLLRFQIKNYKKAEEYYIRAVKANPINTNYLNSCANFLSNIRGKHYEAEKYFLQAIEADDNNKANSLGNYAILLHLYIKDYDKAEDHYLKAIKADNNNANILSNYAIFLKNIKRQQAEAEKYFLQAIKADPNDANILGNYSSLLFTNGDFEEASTYLNKAFALNPTDLMLQAELWFYRYSYFPEYYEQAEEQLSDLVEKGASSPGWDFSPHLKWAEENEHPHLDRLRYYDEQITKVTQ